MRQVVRTVGSNTTCGAGVGTGQMLIQDHAARVGTYGFQRKSRRLYAIAGRACDLSMRFDFGNGRNDGEQTGQTR